MEAARRVVERIARATSPFATYLPQYYLPCPKRARTASRIGDVSSQRYSRGRLSIAAGERRPSQGRPRRPAVRSGILVQLLLLDAVVQAKRKKGGKRTEEAPRRRTTRNWGARSGPSRAPRARDRDRDLAAERPTTADAASGPGRARALRRGVVVFAFYLVAASSSVPLPVDSAAAFTLGDGGVFDLGVMTGASPPGILQAPPRDVGRLKRPGKRAYKGAMALAFFAQVTLGYFLRRAAMTYQGAARPVLAVVVAPPGLVSSPSMCKSPSRGATDACCVEPAALPHPARLDEQHYARYYDDHYNEE